LRTQRDDDATRNEGPKDCALPNAQRTTRNAAHAPFGRTRRSRRPRAGAAPRATRPPAACPCAAAARAAVLRLRGARERRQRRQRRQRRAQHAPQAPQAWQQPAACWCVRCVAPCAARGGARCSPAPARTRARASAARGVQHIAAARTRRLTEVRGPSALQLTPATWCVAEGRRR
jgi:hypothetical protein